LQDYKGLKFYFREADIMDEYSKELIKSYLSDKKSALIVIDVQNDFCHEQGAFSKRGLDVSNIQQRIVPKLASFIERLREFNYPIIFVKTVHSEWTNSPSWLRRMGGMAEEIPICLPNSWGSEFYKVEPKATDCIVIKHRYSAFVGTDLNLILRSKGIQTILITGVVTNVCVETTARDGFNHDFNIILVEDCCGAYFSEEHNGTLVNINKYFGIVTNSDTIINIIKDTKTQNSK